MSKEISKLAKEEILGKEWVAGKAGWGISRFNTHTSNLAFVPGTVKQWDEDLQERVEAIKQWSSKGLLSLTKKMPDAMSGESVLKFCSIPPLVKVVKALKKNPKDHDSRLKLVSIALKQRLDLPVESYRELYLQASVVQHFEKFTLQGVQLALLTQDTYLKRFQAKCRHELRLNEKDLNETSAKLSEDKIKIKKQKISMIRKNINILQEYLDHLEVVNDFVQCPVEKLKSTPNAFNGPYKMPTLKALVMNEGGEKTELFHNSVAIVELLRFHTLLFGVTFRFPELMIRAEKDHALGYFLKGRIYFSQLIFRLSQYEAGSKTETLKKEIQDKFKYTYHSYTEAVRKAGGHYGDGENDIEILIEYANVIRTFLYSIAKTIKLVVPASWAVDNIKRALQLLKQAESDHEKVQLLLKDLGQDFKRYAEAQSKTKATRKKKGKQTAVKES